MQEGADGSLCGDSIVPASPEFPGQFMLTQGTSPQVRFDTQERVGSWVLWANGAHTAVRVRDSRGVDIGLFWGVVVDPQQGIVVRSDIVLSRSAAEAGFIAYVEGQIYRYGGSWIFILAAGEHERVYLDAAGTLSLVYEPETRKAASTTGLLLERRQYEQRFDRELYESLQVEDHGWFPAGLTAHFGVVRLLANHYLDLNTYRSVRHWPSDDAIAPTDELRVAEEILRVVGGTMRALVADGPVVLPLTGGKDSRLLLSACRDAAGALDLVTVDYPQARRDVDLARRLVEQAPQLRHRVIPPELVSCEERALWAYRCSHCVGGANWRYRYELGDGYKYFISGVGGEVGRGFLWRAADNARLRVTARGLIGRFGLRWHPRLEEAIANWLEPLGDHDFFTVLDLAYLELRVSAWAYAQAYAYSGAGTMAYISPLVNQGLFAHFFGLPPIERNKADYVLTAIRLGWPELLNVPVNRYGDWRDYLMLVRKASNPALVLKKLRKLMASA